MGRGTPWNIARQSLNKTGSAVRRALIRFWSSFRLGDSWPDTPLCRSLHQDVSCWDDLSAPQGEKRKTGASKMCAGVVGADMKGRQTLILNIPHSPTASGPEQSRPTPSPWSSNPSPLTSAQFLSVLCAANVTEIAPTLATFSARKKGFRQPQGGRPPTDGPH